MAKKKKVLSRKERTVYELVNKSGEVIFYGKYKKESGKYPEVSLGKKTDDFDVDDALHKLTKFWRGELKSKYDLRMEQEKKTAVELVTTWDGFWKSYGDYSDDKSKPNRDKTSFGNAQKIFEYFIKGYFKNTPPHKVTEQDGLEFKQHILRLSYSGGYKRIIFELFKRILKFNKNLSCVEIPMPKVTRKPKVRPPKDKVMALVELLNSEYYYKHSGIKKEVNRAVANCMLLMRYTGMRSIETRKLKWSDVDFEKKTITLVEPKGGVDAVIPMSDKAREILERAHSDTTGFVFPGRGGKMLPNYSAIAKRYCNHIGMPKGYAPCHGLRALYASELNDNGVPLPHIQKLLTHKNITTTMLYIDVDEQALLEATNLID